MLPRQLPAVRDPQDRGRCLRELPGATLRFPLEPECGAGPAKECASDTLTATPASRERGAQWQLVAAFATTSPLINADFEAFWRFNGGQIWTLGRGARVGLPYMGVENRLFTTLLSQKTMRNNSASFRVERASQRTLWYEQRAMQEEHPCRENSCTFGLRLENASGEQWEGRVNREWRIDHRREVHREWRIDHGREVHRVRIDHGKKNGDRHGVLLRVANEVSVRFEG